MHLLHVKETPSKRTITMETDMSFFKIYAVIISKNTKFRGRNFIETWHYTQRFVATLIEFNI